MSAVYGGADQPVVVDLSPAALGYDWTFGDVTGITTRFSVPLIALAINDRWDPARWHAIVPCPAALVGNKTEGHCTIPVKVVTVARVLGYLSWIFWPLFILRVSSVIRRRG